VLSLHDDLAGAAQVVPQVALVQHPVHGGLGQAGLGGDLPDPERVGHGSESMRGN
jgi:hypothetical protein